MITFEINKSKSKEKKKKKIKNQKQQKQLGTVICPFADIICATNCTFITWDSLLFIGEYGAVCVVGVVFFSLFRSVFSASYTSKGVNVNLVHRKASKVMQRKVFCLRF